ncbi:MAG: carboxylating nicotinate-nucleotide diphosphorylase [Pseudomonadota bacterium]
MRHAHLLPHLIRKTVSEALAEDLGLSGDVTTNAIIDPKWSAVADIVVRVPGMLGGLQVAIEAFRQVDPTIELAALARDGDKVEAGQSVLTVSGNARAILTAERVALNFLGRMSGIASLTGAYVDCVAGTGATIVETRKTTPCLRAFEKYAVRVGGGANHRFGLFDAVLIKDNHIAVAGSVGAAITAARSHAGHMLKIEVEVDTLAQLEEALAHKIDVVLLDNMTLDELHKAVAMSSGTVLTEASGGVNLDTVRTIAETGVNLISIGALTHSAPNMDFGLDINVNTV